MKILCRAAQTVGAGMTVGVSGVNIEIDKADFVQLMDSKGRIVYSSDGSGEVYGGNTPKPGSPPVVLPPVSPVAKAINVVTQQPYASEVAQTLTGGWMQTDSDGNLVNRDGTLFTKARVGMLKDLYDNAQQLLDEAADIHYQNEIKIDGEIHHQGTPPTTFYGSRAGDGKLIHMAGTVSAPPAVDIPEITPGEFSIVVLNRPIGGQMRVGLTGKWKVLLTNQLLPHRAGNTGFVRVVEKSGFQLPNMDYVVTDVLGNEIYRGSSMAFQFEYAVGAPVEGYQTVERGSTLVVTGEGDALFDYRSPAY